MHSPTILVDLLVTRKSSLPCTSTKEERASDTRIPEAVLNNQAPYTRGKDQSG